MDNEIPKYKIVEDSIKLRIKNKELIDRIPAERTLAEEFGFSYMTIRKAINNLVNQGVLYKVPQKGAFVNNAPSKQFFTIGYFLDKTIKSGISSPYYSLIYNAIEKTAAASNHSVIYFSDTNPARLKKVLGKVDGVIATCFPHNEEIIRLMKETLPVVVIDNPSLDKTIPSVVIDNFTADYNTVKYLKNLGHKRIGFMSGLNDSDVGMNRLNGYKQAIQDCGLELEESLIFKGNYSFESGTEGAEYFMNSDNLPDGIICANDSMALGAIQTLQAAGLKIPDDISIIGFDNIEVASQVSPPLTTISAPIHDIAEQAFTMLKNLINHKPLTYQHVSLSTHLITRGSCKQRL